MYVHPHTCKLTHNIHAKRNHAVFFTFLMKILMTPNFFVVELNIYLSLLFNSASLKSQSAWSTDKSKLLLHFQGHSPFVQKQSPNQEL